MPLSGKVAVVTGSSGGIGAAIASTLASAGANVVLGARRIEELEKVKTKIEAEVGGDRVMVCKVDVTKRDEVKALVAAAEAGFGPVDVMVNNAGEDHDIRGTQSKTPFIVESSGLALTGALSNLELWVQQCQVAHCHRCSGENGRGVIFLCVLVRRCCCTLLYAMMKTSSN